MSGNKIIVVGGRQRRKALDLDEWHAYEFGVIASVDRETLEVEVVVEYQTPPDFCADEKPSIVFKAGDYCANRHAIVLCTQTEIIEYDVRNWTQSFYYSHPSFNDLHHACYDQTTSESRQRLLVANTGLDQVIQIEQDKTQWENSAIVNQWTTGTVPTWDKYDSTIDYRKVATTKPHESHPNYVFQRGEHFFATRFHQQDAMDLQRQQPVFQIPTGNPHDGIVRDENVFFTTTNGHVVRCVFDDPPEIKNFDLNLISRHNELLGWCRGLCFENNTHAWVGFSRIRPTWIRKNLSWIKQGFQSKGEYGTRPTRIALYDLEAGRLLQEVGLEPAGINAVFAISCLES